MAFDLNIFILMLNRWASSYFFSAIWITKASAGWNMVSLEGRTDFFEH